MSVNLISNPTPASTLEAIRISSSACAFRHVEYPRNEVTNLKSPILNTEMHQV